MVFLMGPEYAVWGYQQSIACSASAGAGFLCKRPRCALGSALHSFTPKRILDKNSKPLEISLWIVVSFDWCQAIDHWVGQMLFQQDVVTIFPSGPNHPYIKGPQDTDVLHSMRK